MKHVLVVAPHPDDESLGCGGAILKHLEQGDQVHWLIATEMTAESGHTNEQIARRNDEISKVGEAYPFTSVHRLGASTAMLDEMPVTELVGKVSSVVGSIEASAIYLPYPGDAHSDHRALFDACVACTKWFRYPSVQEVLVYETLSETDFGLNATGASFKPNVWVDISNHMERKIEILSLYPTELGVHPFPRSLENVRALAHLRGSQAGCNAAEAFMLLKEIRK